MNLTQADVRNITVSVGQALPGLRVLLTSGVESVAGETDRTGTATLSGYFTDALQLTVEDPSGTYETYTATKTAYTSVITAELTKKLELRVRCSAGGAGAAGLAVEVLVEAKSLGTGETNADGTAVF